MCQLPNSLITTFFFSKATFSLKLKMSKRQLRWLLLLDKPLHSVSFLVLPSPAQQFLLYGNGKDSFITKKEKEPKAIGFFFVTLPTGRIPASVSEQSPPPLGIQKFGVCLLFARNTAGDSGYSLPGNAIT